MDHPSHMAQGPRVTRESRVPHQDLGWQLPHSGASAAWEVKYLARQERSQSQIEPEKRSYIGRHVPVTLRLADWTQGNFGGAGGHLLISSSAS